MISKLVKIFVDLYKLHKIGRQAFIIFLRREYDYLFPFLSLAARIYRSCLLVDSKIICVVGSLGKTTTCHILKQTLACNERQFGYSNYGSTLMQNLLRIKQKDEYSVLEVGIDGPDQMKRYANVIRPDIVVVTSISSDHFHSFPTFEHTRNEKVQMLINMEANQMVFLNGDDPNVLWMASKTNAKVITFGYQDHNQVRAVEYKEGVTGSTFTIRSSAGDFPIQLNSYGKHLAYPILAAYAVTLNEKHESKNIMSKLESVNPVKSRHQLINLDDNIRLIDDSWKAGLETIQVSLAAIKELPAKRKILVFSGVEDPPMKRQTEKEVGRLFPDSVDMVLLLGSKKNMQPYISSAIKMGMRRECIQPIGSNLLIATQVLKKILRPGDVILIKGQGNRKLRRISLLLQGIPVKCNVKLCRTKVQDCDSCPMLRASEKHFNNYFIKRYVETR